MKKSDLFFGVYQIAAGVTSLAALSTTAWGRGATALVSLLAVATLSIAAGALHLKRHRSRFGFTILNQLSQTVGILTPYLTIHIVQGAYAGGLQSMIPAVTAAGRQFQSQVSIGLMESICDVAIGHPLPGQPSWAFSFNFLALVLAWYAMRLRKRAAAS